MNITKSINTFFISISKSTVKKGLSRFFLFAFFVAFIVVSIIDLNQSNRLKNEIVQTQKDIEMIKQDLNKIAYNYSLVSKEYTQKQLTRRIISAVNPLLDDIHIELWTRVARKNRNDISKHLNESSRAKLNIGRNSYSIDNGLSLILSIASLESDFNMGTSSGKGAVGPMQINAITATHIGLKDRTDPEENISAGVKYFGLMLEKFYDYPDQLELALAAYNAGATRVKGTWIRQWGDTWTNIRSGLFNDGRRFLETRNYVNSAVALSHIFISGEWSSKDRLYWSEYKKHARNFDLDSVYLNNDSPE